MSQKTFAFVTGCSRSGTTVLTRLLNRHPDVAIGFERYAYIAAEGGLTPDLFEPERFARFEPEDTHHVSYDRHPDGAGVVDKIASVPVIGDKLPDLIGQLEQLARFPNWRIVFILREPGAVARSFQERARVSAQNNGGWPVDRSYDSAVTEFNAAMREAVHLMDTCADRFHLVNYEELFVGRQGVDEIFRFLGVDPARMANADDIFAASDRLLDRQKIDTLSLAVSRGVDFSLYQHLSRTAGQTPGLFAGR